MASGRVQSKTMQHTKVIENFVREGKEGRGTLVKASDDLLYTQVPQLYHPYGTSGWSNVAGRRTPLAVRLDDGSILANGAGMQSREVTERDDKGREHKLSVHTLGDSVIRVQDRYYVSAVDETGQGSGMYFLAELYCDRPPASVEDALNALKPEVVREAEARGSFVRRQGEWFAIPTKRLTSELMADVARGVAVFHEQHVLGREGHHELEEAVIYHAGPRKGEVYARGVLRHTGGEHRDLSLGALRWHLIVHNVQGASYTLSGRGIAQFD
jgi:hypothetical protein